MEKAKKVKVSLNELYPIIKDKIEGGGSVQLPITGTSMLPLLVWGRDTVEIVKCENAQKGDIIFYRRDNGQFVLHRIIGTDANGYILCGDNQWFKEYGIQDRHIIAVVKSITRKGKRFEVTKLSYVLYSKVWMGIVPLRKYILHYSRKIKSLFNKIFRK